MPHDKRRAVSAHPSGTRHPVLGMAPFPAYLRLDTPRICSPSTINGARPSRSAELFFRFRPTGLVAYACLGSPVEQTAGIEPVEIFGSVHVP